VFCHITDEGLAVLAKLDRPIRDAEDASLTTLSERQLAQLLSLLERARNGLHATLIARRAQESQEARG
jgi:DNA-binding MarR family transcriptional regulator